MKTKPDKIIEYGLIFLIIFTPLAFGSVHVWAYTIVEVVVLLLLLIWLLKHFTFHNSRFTPNPSDVKSKTSDVTPHTSRLTLYPLRFTFHSLRFTIPFSLFLGLVLFQMVPLPATVIKHLSPNTYDLYQQTIGNPLTVKSKALNVTPHDSRLAPRASLLADSSSPIAKNHKPRAMSHEPRSLSIYRNATKTEFLKFFAYFSVFFLIINTMNTFRQIRRIVLTIIFTGTGVAFLALCQILSKSDKIYGFWQSQQALHKIGIYGGQIGKIGSYGGPFINPNHLAGYLEMVIPLALGFLLSREVPGIIRSAKNWKRRLSLLESWLAKNTLLIFIIVLMASAVFISASRGGIISFIFSLGLFSLLLGVRRYHKGKRKMVLLITGLIFIFLLWMGIGPVVTELATLADPKTSGLVVRLQVSKDTLALARDFPLFGVGLGNFQTLYPKYQTFVYPFFWNHAHNDYVEMLADTGWMGLLLFFGGIWLVLFAIIKTWKQSRDPFLAGITLGGFIGAVSLLCHCLVDFNLRIPANAFLLFVILGLMVAAVNIKKKGEEDFSFLPIRAVSFSPKIRTALITAKALIIVFLLTLVIKDYLAYHFFNNYQSLGKAPLADSSSLIDKNHEPRAMSHEPKAKNEEPRAMSHELLQRAIFFDPGNAPYHYELGNYYARKMSESWKRGTSNIPGEQWVFDAEKNARFFGLKALQAYADAVNLSPANAWYHFYRGWTLSELKRFSDFSQHPIPLSEPFDAETEFSRALMLDPKNENIKNYVEAVNSKR